MLVKYMLNSFASFSGSDSILLFKWREMLTLDLKGFLSTSLLVLRCFLERNVYSVTFCFHGLIYNSIRFSFKVFKKY